MILQIVAFLPNALWAIGTKYAGDRRRFGWIVLLVSEAAWLALGVMTHLWTLVGWAVFGAVMYWRNYRKWAP